MTDRKHELSIPAWDSKAYRAQVRRDRNAGRLPRYRARTLLSILDCADRHGAALPDTGQTINFLGLGKVRGALSGIEGQPHGDWYFVHELIPVGPLKVRVRLDEGVAGRTLGRLVARRGEAIVPRDGWAAFEIPSLLDNEVIVIA